MAKFTSLNRLGVFTLTLFAAARTSTLGDVIGIGTQLGHFGLDTVDPVHDFSPAFQSGSQARAYPHGSSAATAGFGSLSLNGVYTSPVVAQWGNADLKLNAYFADTVTIDAPGRTGQAGAFTVSFTFDGSYDANLWWDTTVSINCGFGTDAGDGVIPSMQSASNWGLDNGFSYRGDDTYGFAFGFNMFLGQEQTATIGFTFGQPFDFWLRVGARIHVVESIPGDSRLAVSLAQWSGINRITAGGVAVTDFTVAGAEGTTWSIPTAHPLPAAVGIDVVEAAATATEMTLRAINGLANGPCLVLATADLGAQVSDWLVALRSRFDTTGQFSATIPIAATEAFKFYLVQ